MLQRENKKWPTVFRNLARQKQHMTYIFWKCRTARTKTDVLFKTNDPPRAQRRPRVYKNDAPQQQQLMTYSSPTCRTASTRDDLPFKSGRTAITNNDLPLKQMSRREDQACLTLWKMSHHDNYQWLTIWKHVTPREPKLTTKSCPWNSNPEILHT